MDMFGLERSQREPTQAQESHVNSKQKGHSLDLNPSCFELKVQTIEPPCFYIIIVQKKQIISAWDAFSLLTLVSVSNSACIYLYYTPSIETLKKT